MGSISELVIQAEEELTKEYREQYPNTLLEDWAIRTVIRHLVLQRAQSYLLKKL